MNASWWPRCRHADPKSDASLCVLPPGTLLCPCLGNRGVGQQVADLSVDGEGQLVWTAFDRDNRPLANHTFVAARRDEAGNVRVVRLKPDQKPGLSMRDGVGFFELRDMDDNAGTLTVDELMTRSLQGDEFVTLA